MVTSKMVVYGGWEKRQKFGGMCYNNLLSELAAATGGHTGPFSMEEKTSVLTRVVLGGCLTAVGGERGLSM